MSNESGISAGRNWPGSMLVYELKVTLKGSKPPIWRRIVVPGDCTLHQLHRLLQIAMGWRTRHLYQFEIAGVQYGDLEDEFCEMVQENARQVQLSKVAPDEKARLNYRYDFGDCWDHQVLVEEVRPAEPGEAYPVCVKGRRACPPEDCGGIVNYQKGLEAFKGSTQTDNWGVVAWPGASFDPDRLDLDAINLALKSFCDTPVPGGKTKTGRNDPCPCGSGRKFKKCCGLTVQPQVQATPPIRDRRLMDREMRALHKALENKDFKSLDEMNAFLKQLNAGGGPPKWKPETPLDQAQELVFQALETNSRKDRIRLATQAIQLSQDCADAYVLLAEEAAELPEQACDWYRRGVEAGERALGAEFPKVEAGHFWGIVETRPYMRARAGLADLLWLLGRKDEAIGHYRELMKLNENDNQGIRYRLLGCLIDQGEWEQSTLLLDQFPDEGTAAWLFSRALVEFRQNGDSGKARNLIKEASHANPYVAPLLLGQRRMPQALPDYVGIGDEDEAVAYAAHFGHHWRDKPTVLAWLKAAGLH